MTEYSTQSKEVGEYDDAEMAEFISRPSYEPDRKRWFAWYPVWCWDHSGMRSTGIKWLCFVHYEVWNGSYYYFYGDYDEY